MRLLVKGGQIVDPVRGVCEYSDILIWDGRIEAIAPGLEAEAKTIDVTGKIITPGLVDMHVHLREPGYEAKETIGSGTRSAAAGGFTSVACMPNTKPVLDNQASISFVYTKAKEVGVVNVFPIGAITKGLLGEELAEIGELKKAGVVALSDDGNPVSQAEVMRRGMEYAKMFNLPIISHCEDKSLVGEGVMHEGLMSTILGLKGIPSAAEEVMVAREIILAELTGCHVHIAHVSTAGAVELIRRAKERGLPVTAEVTPHHLTLTDEAVRDYDTNTKVNPPLRTAKDIEALQRGLAEGVIDAIATDHAPHTLEEKDREYNYAPCGMVGLETAVPLIMTRLVDTGILTLPQAIAKLSVNPARILGIDKGVLKVGGDADLAIIDPDLERTIDVNKFYSQGKNSPFHGWCLKGFPVITIVGGKIVFEYGKITNERSN